MGSVQRREVETAVGVLHPCTANPYLCNPLENFSLDLYYKLIGYPLTQAGVFRVWCTVLPTVFGDCRNIRGEDLAGKSWSLRVGP